jgi:hypothetical protein
MTVLGVDSGAQRGIAVLDDQRAQSQSARGRTRRPLGSACGSSLLGLPFTTVCWAIH